MFDPQRILYEDNHLLVVNKRAGELVQPDPTGDPALEDEIKAFLGAREAKPGNVFHPEEHIAGFGVPRGT